MNEPTGRRTRVAVVFGGRSSEHAISCVTAGSVLKALDSDRYEVIPIGIATDGRWVLESGDPDRLSIGPGCPRSTATGAGPLTRTGAAGLVVAASDAPRAR